MNFDLRRVAMTIGLATVLGGSLLVAGTDGRGTADIPFGFRVQDRDLPAGSYMVEEMTSVGVLRVRNLDTGDAIFVMAQSSKSGEPGDAKLIFNRYGDRYFLSQVWFDGDNTGHVVKMGHLEKELAGKGGTPGVLALIRFK